MTARVTTLKGADAGAYYVEALPSYYLDANEPPGRWHGRGTDMLGLHGEMRDEDFLDIMAGVYPGSRGVLLGRAYGESSVRGFDITANAPKSVSVLFALGDDFARHEALTSHDAAVAATVRWIEAHAHTRFRTDGEVAVVDAEGIVAATFCQHTSRALDPHLHTHVVVANRVRSPDGRWLALDARTLKLDQRTLSAIYHATLRTELTARLGVHWEPVVNGIAEIDGIDKIVLEEFSSRTTDVSRRVDEKLDRFIDTLERDPTPRERWQLEREAVIDSRPPKAHGLRGQALHEQWRTQVETLGLDPATVVDNAVWPSRARPLTAEVESSMISQALHALAEKQSSWRPAEITRELAAVLPTDLGIDPKAITGLLDRLTADAIGEGCVDISRPIPDGATLRRDHRPITEAATDRALTTPEILAQERELATWAERRTTASSNDSTEAPHRADVELTAAQAETAAAVAGDAHLVLVVGPAGTGKTTALKPPVEQLHAEGRAVFGLAPSAVAAEVLATETGTTADTIDKLLFEHSANRLPTHTYDLPRGTTVIVDEAGMVSTDKLHQLATLADNRAWRVVLVGDSMQFSAVGRGGMFEYLIDTCGAIELDQVHRFSNQWERSASLQLRRGDPSVATVYDAHGRLHGGTTTRMQRDALDVWSAARQTGETVLLTAPTNETVNALNLAAQQRRVEAGELDTRRHITVGDGRLYVGDEIVTRRNQRQLFTDQHHMVRNRDNWTIIALHRNGDITATGGSGTVRLPADYVATHVELGYAQTSHAAQGRTVDRSILVLDGPSDVRGIYVPLTRGRHHNDAYITTTGEQTAVDVFADSIARSWIDRPAIARQAELAGTERHRPGTLPADQLRALFGEQAQLAETLNQLNIDLRHLPTAIDAATARIGTASASRSVAVAELAKAAEVLDTYDRPLKRRRHEPEIIDARSKIERLPDRIKQLDKTIRSETGQLDELRHDLADARRLNARRPEMDSRLEDVGSQLADDRRIRTRQLRRNPPERITNTIGERPVKGDRIRAWDNAVGYLDQHQSAHDLTSGLGPTQGPAVTGALLHSRALAASTANKLTQDNGISHDNSMRIGR